MSTRTRLLVTVLAAWSLFVWVNRITNAWTGDEGLFSKLVSTVLAAASIALAVVVWRAVSADSEALEAGPRRPELSL